MSRIIIHPLATAEAGEAAVWYAERSKGASARFRRNLRAALDRIGTDPLRYPRIDEIDGEPIRALRMQSFPYSVLFVVVGERIDILAFAHQRRWPGYWRSRFR